MITIKKLTKRYGRDVHALRGIDLEIGSGIFGLVGPNGAGKTTLLRILAGLLRPTSGSVKIDAHDITTAAGKRAVKEMLGYLPQQLGFYPNLTAREFLDYIAILKGITDKKARRRQIEELIEQVNLNEVADRKIKEYSGGIKRRVGIAQALLGKPKLLIVDEPSAGLDPEERVRLRNILAKMASRGTIILSTHIIEDISQSCQSLAVLHKGGILFRGSPRELTAQAKGHVFRITTANEPPTGEFSLLSSIPLEEGIQYRVLGTPTGYANATSVEPTLEDGYIWLMRSQLD
jgi:ABC-type multidrug transport system ATPase subunit